MPHRRTPLTGRGGTFVPAFFLLLFLAACAAPVHAEEIYVLNRGSGNFTVYDGDSLASAAPLRTVTASSSNTAYGIAVSDNEVFVSVEGGGRGILVYNATANGNVGYKRIINGTGTEFGQPQNLCIDNGDLYVADVSARNIYVFNKADGANVAPKRTLRLQDAAGHDFAAYGLSVYGGELYFTTSTNASIMAVPKSSNGTVVPSRIISSPKLSAGARGLYVDGSGIYVGGIYDSNKHAIVAYALNSSGPTDTLWTINGTDTGLADAHSLFRLGDTVYVASYSDGSHGLQAFNASGPYGNVASMGIIANAANGISYPTATTFVRNSEVTVPAVEPEGVTVTLADASATAPADSPVIQASSLAGRADLKSGAMEFNATVSPANSVAVFMFNSTTMSGTPVDYILYKVFSDGTTRPFTYAANATYTDGAWWLTDANDNWFAQSDALTSGTNYFIHLAVEDNGNYDSNPAAGQITDPSILAGGGGTGLDGGGSGCVLRHTPSNAWDAAEWLLVAALLGLAMILRRRLRR